MHLDRENRLKHKFDQHFAMECPHCQVLSHLSLMAAPKFDDLMRFKPKQVGIVYRCDSCNSPVFLRFPVRSYGSLDTECAVTLEQRCPNCGGELVHRPTRSTTD